MPPVAYISLAIMSLWAIEALLCALQVKRFVRDLRRPMREQYLQFKPRAAVIVPFKGADEDLPAAVRSLCTQDYPDYRLLLVVDSIDDPAFAVLTEETAKYPQCKADILVSGQTPVNQSQKIHNQLHAIEQLTARDEVWAFADSDAVPGPDWLSKMVGPLMNPNNGMTTGYRWLVPAPEVSPAESGATGGSPTSASAQSLPSKLASILNSSVACGYRSRGLSQAWGGAMAITAAAAKEGDLVGYLRGALTDDYQFTRMCNQLGKRVYFVPRALAATPVDFTWPTFFNFAHRQYLITRIYAPRLFFAGLAVLAFWTLGLLTTLAALAHGLFIMPLDRFWWATPSAVLIAIAVFNRVRAAYRRKAIRLAFGDEVLEQLKPTLQLDRHATCLWMPLHLLIMLRALIGNTMNWRGIRYKLRGPQRIERLD